MPREPVKTKTMAACCAHCGKEEISVALPGPIWICRSCYLAETGLFFVGNYPHRVDYVKRCPMGHEGPVKEPNMTGWWRCPACTETAGIAIPVSKTESLPRPTEPRQLKLL